jgi:transposase InsO family protein
VHYGIPRAIIHDQGSAFTSKMFQKLMVILGIQNLQTAAHQTACNGRVERNNRVNSALTHVVNALQRDWDLRLTDLEFAIGPLHTRLLVSARWR